MINRFILASFICLSIAACNKSGNDAPPLTGIGGSMARFTIAFNHLYVIDDRNLKVFNIQEPNNPLYIQEIHVGFNIETVFPFNNYLFIGSQMGMYIYDLTNPEAPVFVSEFMHIMSCDPVVANDSLAFVTLRSGTECNTNVNINQLQIIDIRNIAQPALLKTFDMNTPNGLAIDSNLLFICHGEYGFGVYNFSALPSLDTITYFNNIKTFDVIPHNKILHIIGESGLFQYDYNNVDSIFFISSIPLAQ